MRARSRDGNNFRGSDAASPVRVTNQGGKMAETTASLTDATGIRRSGGRERLFRFIMIVGFTLFVAACTLGAELAARCYERQRTTPPDYFPSIYYPHSRLRYGLIPNTDYFGWFKINSLGFRGREISAAKRPGVARVICLGGSTTFDIGTVGAAKPWPEVLERELRTRLGTDAVEVFNFGISGATSLDSLIDLQMRGLSFEPDLVIVYQGHNDLIYSISAPGPTETSLFPQEDRPRSSFKRWLILNSVLYAKTSLRISDRIGSVFGFLGKAIFGRGSGRTSPDHSAAMERGLVVFRSNIASLAAIARVNNIPVVLPGILIPFSSGTPTAERCKACDDLSQTYGGLGVPALKMITDRYNGALEELAAEANGIYYIRTEGFVPPTDRYYHDPVHFGPEGSQEMGIKLAEAVAPLLMQRRRDR